MTEAFFVDVSIFRFTVSNVLLYKSTGTIVPSLLHIAENLICAFLTQW